MTIESNVALRASQRGSESIADPVISAVLAISAVALVYGACLTISLIQEEDNALSGPATALGRRLCPVEVLGSGLDVPYESAPEKDRYIEWRKNRRQGKFDDPQASPPPKTDAEKAGVAK